MASVLGFATLAVVGLQPAVAYSNPAHGYIQAIAGGAGGDSGDGGSALVAGFRGDGEVRVDPSNGNVLFVDSYASRVRIIPKTSGTYYGVSMTADDIYTIAGNGTAGYSGEAGPGPSAQLDSPHAIAIAPAGPYAGAVLIGDTGNHVIRVVPMTSGVYFGNPYVAGDIYTFVGSGTSGYLDGPALSAQFSSPLGLAIDNFGNIVISDSDSGNGYLRVFAGSTGTFYGQSMTLGDVYTIAGSDPCVDCASWPLGRPSHDLSPLAMGDGGSALAALLDPRGVFVAANGNVVVADSYNHAVRVVAESTSTYFGVSMKPTKIYTIVGAGYNAALGDGGLATAAGVRYPSDLSLDNAGNLVFADQWHFRIRVVAENTGTFYGQSMIANHIYTIAGDGNAGAFGDGGPAVDAEFDYPSGVAVDATGNVLVEDDGSNKIRAIAPLVCAIASQPDPSQLSLASTADLTSLTPGAQSQWTATIHNNGAQSESCVVVDFTVTSGAIAKSSETQCTFIRSGESSGPVIEAECMVDSIAAGADVPVSVFVQTTGLKSGAQIDGNVAVASNFTGTESQPLPTITVADPTPGQVQSHVAPGASAATDKGVPGVGDNAGVTVISKMKLPKLVTPGTDVPPMLVAQPFATTAPLVTSKGALVQMLREAAVSQTGAGQLCDPGPHGACKGDIITLDPFVNYNDPLHPAVLTLSWAANVVNGVVGTLYIATEAHPEGTAVPACGKKLKTGYATLPCFSKAAISTKGTTIGNLTITVQILSSNDPGFVRK